MTLKIERLRAVFLFFIISFSTIFIIFTINGLEKSCPDALKNDKKIFGEKRLDKFLQKKLDEVISEIESREKVLEEIEKGSFEIKS